MTALVSCSATFDRDGPAHLKGPAARRTPVHAQRRPPARQVVCLRASGSPYNGARLHRDGPRHLREPSSGGSYHVIRCGTHEGGHAHRVAFDDGTNSVLLGLTAKRSWKRSTQY